MKVRAFTLVEILVAVVVFSVLSVLAWRGLEALTRSRTFLTHFLDNSLELSRGMRQINVDLSQTLSNRVSNTAVVKVFSDGFLLLRSKKRHDVLKGMRYQWVRYWYDAKQKLLYRYAMLTANKNFLYDKEMPPSFAAFKQSRSQSILKNVTQFKLEGYIAGRAWITLYKSSKGLGSTSTLFVGAPFFHGFRVSLREGKVEYKRVISITNL